MPVGVLKIGLLVCGQEMAVARNYYIKEPEPNKNETNGLCL